MNTLFNLQNHCMQKTNSVKKKVLTNNLEQKWKYHHNMKKDAAHRTHCSQLKIKFHCTKEDDWYNS